MHVMVKGGKANRERAGRTATVQWRACPMSAARSGLSHDLCFKRTSARSKAPTIVAQSTRSKAVACLCMFA